MWEHMQINLGYLPADTLTCMQIQAYAYIFTCTCIYGGEHPEQCLSMGDAQRNVGYKYLFDQFRNRLSTMSNSLDLENLHAMHRNYAYLCPPAEAHTTQV